MTLTVVDQFPEWKIRAGKWRQTGGFIYQRATFTGHTKQLRLGPSARWTCEIDLATFVGELGDGEEAMRVQRNVLGFLQRPGRAFRLIAVDEAQTANPVPATCLVNGAGQLGFTLAVDGLPASTPILRAGHLISVALPGGDEQLLTLQSLNFASNAAGQVTFEFDMPLRAAPADNAVVRIRWPVAVMRVRDPMGWDLSAGNIYQIPPLTAEEAF
jgi:hypothetical protein